MGNRPYPSGVAFRGYLTSEVVEDWSDGLISRREALRRLALLGISASAAAAAISAATAPVRGQSSDPSVSVDLPPGAPGLPGEEIRRSPDRGASFRAISRRRPTRRQESSSSTRTAASPTTSGPSPTGSPAPDMPPWRSTSCPRRVARPRSGTRAPSARSSATPRPRGWSTTCGSASTSSSGASLAVRSA